MLFEIYKDSLEFYNSEEFAHYDLGDDKELLISGEIFGISEGAKFDKPSKSNISELFNGVIVPSALIRMNGQFFGFITQGGKVTHIFNDLFAGKRVYWVEKEDRLVFNDDIESLAGFGNKIDKVELTYFLTHGYTNPESTFFTDLHKLGPGSIWTFESSDLRENFSVEKQKFFDRLTEVAFQPNVTNFFNCLSSYVARIAGNDNILLLSGGVDSILLTSIAKRLGVANLKAITGYYDNPLLKNPYIDKKIATKISGHFNIDHLTEKFDFGRDITLPNLQFFNSSMPFDAHLSIWHHKLYQQIASKWPGGTVINGENADAILALGLSGKVKPRRPGTYFTTFRRMYYSHLFLTLVASQGLRWMQNVTRLTKYSLDKMVSLLLGKELSLPAPIHPLNNESFLKGFVVSRNYFPFLEREKKRLSSLIHPHHIGHYIDEIISRSTVLSNMDWEKLQATDLHNIIYLLKLTHYMQGKNVRIAIDVPKQMGLRGVLPFRNTPLFASFALKPWGCREVLRGKHQVRDSLKKFFKIDSDLRKADTSQVEFKARGGAKLSTQEVIKRDSFLKFFKGAWEESRLVDILHEEYFNSKTIFTLVNNYIEKKRFKDPKFLFRLGWVANTLLKNKDS